MGLVSLGDSPPLHLKMETERVHETKCLKVIHVRVLIKNSRNKTNKITTVNKCNRGKEVKQFKTELCIFCFLYY